MDDEQAVRHDRTLARPPKEETGHQWGLDETPRYC
jgi:hypothetical protein